MDWQENNIFSSGLTEIGQGWWWCSPVVSLMCVSHDYENLRFPIAHSPHSYYWSTPWVCRSYPIGAMSDSLFLYNGREYQHIYNAYNADALKCSTWRCKDWTLHFKVFQLKITCKNNRRLLVNLHDISLQSRCTVEVGSLHTLRL